MKKEIKKLATLLTKAGIPYELRTDSCGNKDNQLFYPSKANRICDAICHQYSYGYDTGLLEIMGLCENTEDDVEGWLSAEEVFTRIAIHYINNNRNYY